MRHGYSQGSLSAKYSIKTMLALRKVIVGAAPVGKTARILELIFSPLQGLAISVVWSPKEV